MNRIILLIIIFIISLSMLSCTNKNISTVKNNTHVETSNLPKKEQSLKNNLLTNLTSYNNAKNIDLSNDNMFKQFNKYPGKITKIPILINTDIGEDLLSFDVYENKLYYSEVYYFDQFVNKTDIFCYDIINKTTSKIYQYNNSNLPSWIYDITACKDYLFWVETYPSEEERYKIYKLNLTNNKLDVIRSYKSNPSLFDPSLTINDTNLFWIEGHKNKLTNEKTHSIISYSIQNDTIDIINDNMWLNNPYSRVTVNDNIITYPTLDTSTNNIIINTYNIITQKTQQLLTDEKSVFHYESDGTHTLWCKDPYGESHYLKQNLHIYNNEKNILYYFPIEDNNKSANVVTFFNNNLFVLFMPDYNQYENVYYFNLDTLTKTNITNNTDKNMSILSLQKTLDGRIIYEMLKRKNCDEVTICIYDPKQ